MNLPDACRRLGLTYARVYRLVLAGQLPAERGIDGRWRLDREAVERLAQQRADAASRGAEATK